MATSRPSCWCTAPASSPPSRWSAPGCWLNLDPIGNFVGVADATRAGYVNPGLTLHALVIFSQPATWTAATIDLSLSGYRFREDDPCSLEPQAWVLDGVLARGPLPIAMRT